MRRGCIAICKVECDGCHRSLDQGERYLVVDDEKGEKRRFCIDCCLARGYASYGTEKEKEKGAITFSFEG